MVPVPSTTGLGCDLQFVKLAKYCPPQVQMHSDWCIFVEWNFFFSSFSSYMNVSIISLLKVILLSEDCKSMKP